MEQENQEIVAGTEIVVATCEPEVPTFSIEEMLELPEAESAIEQEHNWKAFWQERWPRFMGYLFAERRDVWARYQCPLMDWFTMVNRPNASEIDKYGLHTPVKQEGASLLYKPKVERKHLGPSPLTGVSREIWVDEAAAWVPSSMRDPEGIVRGFDPGIGHGETIRMSVWMKNSGEGWINLGEVQDVRFEPPSFRYLRPFWSAADLSTAGSNFLKRAQEYAAKEQEAKDALASIESRFQLPVGTLSVYCMPARNVLSAVNAYLDSTTGMSASELKKVSDDMRRDWLHGRTYV